MRDLHEVVDLRPGTDHRVVDAASIDRRVGADLDVVLDDAAADMRDLVVNPVAIHVAKPVGAEACAGVHVTRAPSVVPLYTVTAGKDADVRPDDDARPDDTCASIHVPVADRRRRRR